MYPGPPQAWVQAVPAVSRQTARLPELGLPLDAQAHVAKLARGALALGAAQVDPGIRIGAYRQAHTGLQELRRIAGLGRADFPFG